VPARLSTSSRTSQNFSEASHHRAHTSQDLSAAHRWIHRTPHPPAWTLSHPCASIAPIMAVCHAQSDYRQVHRPADRPALQAHPGGRGWFFIALGLLTQLCEQLYCIAIRNTSCSRKRNNKVQPLLCISATSSYFNMTCTAAIPLDCNISS
jgi:hypothetical protein